MYVFQDIYLLTMARIWHVFWHVNCGPVPIRFRCWFMLCSMLHSVTESGTSVCTQVPTFHLLLQQPAASAPRPATRPASATKQQQPPAALATAPPLRRLHRQLRLRRLSDRPASGSRRLPRQRRLPVPGGPAAAAEAAPAASARRHRRRPAADLAL